jgi:hypothetical protein
VKSALSSALAEARELARELAGDIGRAKTREEHVRVSARANAAGLLVLSLENLAAAEADVPAA